MIEQRRSVTLPPAWLLAAAAAAAADCFVDQGNVKGADLAQGSLGASDTVATFHGPSPPAGSHRYVPKHYSSQLSLTAKPQTQTP